MLPLPPPLLARLSACCPDPEQHAAVVALLQYCERNSLPLRRLDRWGRLRFADGAEEIVLTPAHAAALWQGLRRGQAIAWETLPRAPLGSDPAP